MDCKICQISHTYTCTKPSKWPCTGHLLLASEVADIKVDMMRPMLGSQYNFKGIFTWYKELKIETIVSFACTGLW